MQLEFVPLLHIQRELYRLPRGPERFQAYLKTMLMPDGQDVRLPPLVAMNPMGKDHVPARLDAWLALDAEGVAARAVAVASARLRDTPGEFKIGLVLADDAQGGWTNRFSVELAWRVSVREFVRDGWLSAILWSSEEPTIPAVTEAVLATLFRADHLARHGPARTLREILAQEGRVMALAGCACPALASGALTRSREIIAPHLNADATDLPSVISCLFGDDAAVSLGYAPLGLPPRAGLALALHDARAVPQTSHHASTRSKIASTRNLTPSGPAS
jgi:hypothetical protein